jgi:hypothetical protein
MCSILQNGTIALPALIEAKEKRDGSGADREKVLSCGMKHLDKQPLLYTWLLWHVGGAGMAH